ncbi:MAG: hypothetical protein LBR56_05665 [Sporomusaceae bacterium]|nr:hypothetical protein [Sporomusaceae bacterium]
MIQDFLSERTAGWFQEDAPLIADAFYQDKDAIAAALAQNLAALLQQAQVLAATGKKGTAAYICISFLYTNLLRDIWQYRLDVYDQNFFLDQTECSGLWETEFAFNCLKTRLENLGQEIKGSIYANKVRQHHLNSVKMALGVQYHAVATVLTKNIIEDVIDLLKEEHFLETSHLQIMMGEYKDLSLLLSSAKK